MRAYATADDLAARWRELTEAEEARAEALLADASAMVASALSRAGLPEAGGTDVEEANLRAVACAMVRRAMSVADDMAGVTQASQTAGSYSVSATYANPAANLYLTAAERRTLGMGRMRMRSLHARIGGGDADDTW